MPRSTTRTAACPTPELQDRDGEDGQIDDKPLAQLRTKPARHVHDSLDGRLPLSRQYIDAQGQAIKLEDTRTEPALKFSSHGTERLDPGQDGTQALGAEFPAEALQAKRFKDIRLELTYIPSPSREERVNFTVSIGEGK